MPHQQHNQRILYASTMKYPKTHTPQKQNRGICNNKTQPVKNPSRFCHGGHSERETPGPIPNPEVKPPSADGTAHASVWESKTPPDNTPNAPTTHQLWGRNHTPTKNHHPSGRSGFTPIRARGIGRSPIIRGDSREKELRGRGSASHPRWITNQLNHLRGSQYPEIPRPGER